MIIDCFPFFNELDILDIRLNVLSKYVDKFILVEASKTQSKIDKPFYFEENKSRFKAFLDKIVHIKIDDYPNENGWAMENFQRNCINIGLEQIGLKHDDVVAISDVDEIWDPKKLPEIIHNLNTNHFVSLQMDYFVFYLNLNTVNKNWIGTVFTKYSTYMPHTPQYIRNIKDHVYIINNAGWHFGYQGGMDMVYKKYLSCIEPINKDLLPSKDLFFAEFTKRIKDGGSFIYSDNLLDQSVKLKKIDISTDSNFPDHIVENKKIYEKMIL